MIDETRLLNLFVKLCRINTPPLAEKPLVDFVQAHLEQMGLVCCRDNAHIQLGGDTGNLIATLPANVPHAPSLFFSAHFDTVEPNPDVPIIIDDGVVHTDGSAILGADDKGGMAPIIEAVQVLIEDDLPHGEIQLLFSIAEEIGVCGAKHMDKNLITSRMGYVLDTGPPVGGITVTAPTHDILDITITGKPAHAGAEPEKGVSAIVVAAEAIGSMRLGRIDEMTTANIGVIHGGTATNIIPAQVKIRAEARSRDSERLKIQIQHMKDSFEIAAKNHGATVAMEVTREYETYTLPHDSPVIQLAHDAAMDIGLKPILRAGGGGSDANEFNRVGIPACVLGTGMTAVHTHQEHISVADMKKSAAWLLAIVRRSLNSEKESIG